MNTKFGHLPELTGDMFLCAVRDSKTLEPAFNKAYTKAKAENIIEEARRAAEPAIENSNREDRV